MLRAFTFQYERIKTKGVGFMFSPPYLFTFQYGQIKTVFQTSQYLNDIGLFYIQYINFME